MVSGNGEALTPEELSASSGLGEDVGVDASVLRSAIDLVLYVLWTPQGGGLFVAAVSDGGQTSQSTIRKSWSH